MNITSEASKLLVDGVQTATLSEGVDAKSLIKAIDQFVTKKSRDGYCVEVKNDEESLGIIVDIWEDEERWALVDTATFWFDDFYGDN